MHQKQEVSCYAGKLPVIEYSSPNLSFPVVEKTYRILFNVSHTFRIFFEYKKTRW